jgi:hypothetical protein
MQENNSTKWVWEEPLASDVWGIEKSFGEYTPEEEFKAAWRDAVAVLEGFCQVADGLNHEPLILALVDAKVRAEEELERLRDRVERLEGVQLSEREDERLLGLMRRSDALSNACAAMEDWSEERHLAGVSGALPPGPHRDAYASSRSLPALPPRGRLA